jgi:UDP-2,4-diacetamido-2,4,6-trideoxy-beta-L-altropyranose hydrolase
MRRDKEIIIFKVSSSKKIGSGHIYRCLKIAKKIKDKEIFFFTNNFNGNFNYLIKKFALKIFNNVENNFDIKKDLSQTISYLRSINKKKILVIDNYLHNLSYQKKISKYVDKLVIIDDYLRKNYCDIYINENFFIKTPNSKKFLNKNCIKFIGPKYNFIVNKIQKKIKKKKINLFIFFGGSDVKEYSLKIITFLKEDKNLFFRLVLNNQNIKNKIYKIGIKNFKIYNQTPNFYNILKYCNFSIIAGGSTVWDVLYNQVPAMVIPTAHNQIRNLKNLKKNNNIFLLKKIENKKNFNKFFYSSYLSRNKISKLNISCNSLKKIIKEIVHL